MTSPATAPMVIEPFYLGPADRQIFACFHPPAEPARDCGVLICYPIWQEYVRAHRACRRLSQQLAEAGFPNMRFDYFGTGDSAGEDIDADVDQWKTNIGQAIDELRDRSGVSTICLIGLRLGASLAAAVTAERRGIASLVLWEPVIDGKRYIEELTLQHQDEIRRFLVQPKGPGATERPTELLGFAISPRQLDAIEAIDLLAAKPTLARNILLIESSSSEPVKQLAEQLKTQTARVSYQPIPSFNFWTEHADKRLVPSEILSALVDWVREVHP
jgi:uncharacterized protein